MEQEGRLPFSQPEAYHHGHEDDSPLRVSSARFNDVRAK
jgi:hypothetical protein